MRKPSPALVRILCIGTVLGAMLTILRTRMLLSWSDLQSPGRLLSGIAVGAYSDLAFVSGLTTAFSIACIAAARWPRLQRGTSHAFVFAACASLVIGFVNVRAVAELGRPINYQWLYYSDFMRSLDTYTALAELTSWSWAGRVALACLGLLLGSLLLARAADWAARHTAAPRVTTAGAGFFLAYLGAGWLWQLPQGWVRASVENPVIVLAASLLDADANPVLAKVSTGIGPQDFLTAGARGQIASRSGYAGLARDAQVRNVIIVTLESVAAQYLPGFGSSGWGLTPELERSQQSARRFVSFYAHQPSTTYSLVALLLSVYPPHSFRAVTREHPDIALPSLSSELKRHGYRTASFDAGDNRFQRADEFLSHRQFDLISDVRSGSCRDSPAPGPVRDECAVRDLLGWIDRDSRRPFFALLWTAQTHFPYAAGNSPSSGAATLDPGVIHWSLDRDSRRRLPRYMRALNEMDRAVGGLLRQLEARKLLDSTLVVVMGDHGEAFGQHGNAFHRYLYEEEVRVPLLLINSRVFHGELDSVPGGIIDLAPTIMELLGYQGPPEWQGRSLFDPERHGRVYLFGPYSGLVGFREGTKKLIHNPVSGETEVYDLAADPDEKVNVAHWNPAMVNVGRERLAAWVQFQQRFYARLDVSR